MSYCINPWCQGRENAADSLNCCTCGTPLWINSRIRLIKPLRPLDPLYRTEIFEVEDRGTSFQGYLPGTRRVMKILKSQDPKVIELFEREELVLRVLDHPAIPRVTIDDCFTFQPNNADGELRCLVMQKIEGENLEAWIETHGRISQAQALTWLHQLVNILDHIHQSGFFHRDIKPSNIILQENEQLALIDFGTVREISNTYLARVSAVGRADQRLGKCFGITVVRSAGYSPVEQVEGHAVPQSDFFALGRTLTYLMTGVNPTALPFSQESRRIIWRSAAPQIRKPFADLIDWLMAPSPGKRPQNTQIILDYLENRFKLKLFLRLSELRKSLIFKVGVAIAVMLLAFALVNLGIYWHVTYQSDLRRKQSRDYLVLGLQKYTLGEMEEARKAYEQSLALNSKNSDTLEYLALVCQQLKDANCTLQAYEQLLALKPEFGKGHFRFGVFWDTQGEWAKAEEQYKLALQFGALFDYQILSRLSRLNNKTGHYQSAQEYALQALEILNSQNITDKASRAMLEKDLGWASVGQKFYSQAEVHLKTAISLDPTQADAKCLLVKVLEVQSKFIEATQIAAECLKLDSQLPEVQEWRLDAIHRLRSQSSEVRKQS